MPSELQRVAQGLVDALDEMPRIVAYLQRTAQKCRENAAYVGGMSNNPAAQMAAMQLDEAARRCDEAAHFLSQAPPKARIWAQQMVSGIRTAGPGSAPGGQRPDAPLGWPAQGESRRAKEATKPPVEKSRDAAASDNSSSPDDDPPLPRISDEQGRDLQRRLPVRATSPGQRDKTRGLWVDGDGQEHDLTSGEADFSEDLKNFLVDNKIGRADGDLMVALHAESKFAMFMRQRGLMHETIAVNKLPCKGKWGCEELLGRILPSGATLTVFGPNNFKETYPLRPRPERTDSA